VITIPALRLCVASLAVATVGRRVVPEREDRPSELDLLVDFASGASLSDQTRFVRELRELLDVDVDVVSAGALTEDDADILADAPSVAW